MTGKFFCLKLLGGFIVLLFLNGAAWSAEQTFDRLDKNGDRRLDMKELDEAARTVLQAYDRNGDGRLDPSEFKRIKDAKSSFRDLDTTKDGQIDADELKKAAEKRFKVCDKNGDGAIDAEEMEACMARTAQEGSPAAEAEKEKRIRFFDRSQRRSVQKENQRIGSEEIPSSPLYRPIVSPLFSIYF